MNLYQYFKAIARDKDKMINPVLISEDTTKNMAVITYNQIAPSFDWDIPQMRNARGLVLDMTNGNVVSRPYPKFFNYGENDSAYWPKDTTGMVVEEKLDGSLVIVSTYDDNLVISSSGSLTSQHAELFTSYLNTHMNTDQLAALKAKGKEYTMLFEYVAPDNKIVIQYDKENMILHGAIKTQQDNEDIDIPEMPYDELSELGEKLGIDVVTQYKIETFDEIQDILNDNLNIEGFVVKFPNGHRLKFKTDEYVQQHRIATNLDLNVDSRKLRETFVNAIVNNNYDDLLPHLTNTRELLDEMLTDSKQFISEAHKQKTTYLKNTKHLIDVPVDIEGIKRTIHKLPEQIHQISAHMQEEINDYLDKVNDEELQEKGYNRIKSIINNQSAQERKAISSYRKTVSAKGLINTTELDNKQKALVAKTESTTIRDAHIKNHLFGQDITDTLDKYLTETYVVDVEKSNNQKVYDQLRQLQSATDILNGLQISSDTQASIQDVLQKVNDELESELVDVINNQPTNDDMDTASQHLTSLLKEDNDTITL